MKNRNLASTYLNNNFVRLLKTNKDKINRFLFLAVFLFLFYRFAFFIGAYAIDVPYWDQWDVSDLIIEKKGFKELFFHQHNAHRIGFPLLIMKFLGYYLTNWSQIAEIYFSSFLITSAALIAFFIKKSIKEKIVFSDILLLILFFNLFQHANLLWGFQIAFIFPFFFLFCSLLLLRIKTIKIRNLFLSAISFLSVFSSFHGLFLPILLILYLIGEIYYVNKKLFKPNILTVFILFSIIAFHFIGYESNLKEFSTNFWIYFKHIFTSVSAGFFYLKQNLFINLLIFLFVIGIYFFSLIELLRKKFKDFSLITGLMLISFALLFSFSISMGRASEYPVENVFSSRYVTYLILYPLGIYFLGFYFKNKFYILKILIIIFLVSNQFIFFKESKNLISYRLKQQIKGVQCYQDKTRSFDECFEIFKLYPNKKSLHKRIQRVFQYKNGRKN